PDAPGCVPRADALGGLLQPRRRPAVPQARSEDHRMSRALQAEPGIVADGAPVRRRRFLWRVIRERPSAAVGAVVLVLLIAVAALAPFIAPYGLHQQVGPTFGPPSS